MRNCTRCGGSLRRVHRTLLERLGYLAIYQCKRCNEEHVMMRRWRYHFGPEARCPLCGTRRITRLQARDHIDPMRGGLLNWLERLASGRLYHCRFCRIQFYDRRENAPARGGISAPRPTSLPAEQSPQQTA